MAIELFGAYGLIVLKNSKTEVFIDRRRAELLALQARFLLRMPDGPALPTFEDKHLFTCRSGASWEDAESSEKELERDGCVVGTDFVRIERGEVTGPLPLWLELTAEGYAHR